MRRIAGISVEAVVPGAEAVLRAQGVPPEASTDERLLRPAHEALGRFRELAEPTAIVGEIAASEFAVVYEGQGLNETETPVARIYRLADHLALFAVTMGEAVSKETGRLFDEGEFAAGAMLDAAASEGTELACRAATSLYRDYLANSDRRKNAPAVLPFSPGYCGWHVSGQRKLFEFLRPEEIGIELSASFLMRPLKSISGVIIAGPKNIFEFDDDFPFCESCRTRSCRDRIRALQGRSFDTNKHEE